MALNSAGEASSQCTLTIEPKPVEETPQEPSGSAPKFTKLLTDVLVAEDDKVVFEGWYLTTYSTVHTNFFTKCRQRYWRTQARIEMAAKQHTHH